MVVMMIFHEDHIMNEFVFHQFQLKSINEWKIINCISKLDVEYLHENRLFVRLVLLREY